MLLNGIAFLAVGLFMVSLGIYGWRVRKEERISLIEAAILKAGAGEPLPRNGWDRAMAYAQPILLMTFGVPTILLGLVFLFA
jgi:hypothetical protein